MGFNSAFKGLMKNQYFTSLFQATTVSILTSSSIFLFPYNYYYDKDERVFPGSLLTMMLSLYPPTLTFGHKIISHYSLAVHFLVL